MDSLLRFNDIQTKLETFFYFVGIEMMSTVTIILNNKRNLQKEKRTIRTLIDRMKLIELQQFF